MCSRRLYRDHMRCWDYVDVTERFASLWEGAKYVDLGAIGEPSLVPWFDRLLAYFDARNIEVSFVTNGSRLDVPSIRKHKLGYVLCCDFCNRHP